MVHMHLPDGTYLASEFNYSLPRHHKGYDSVCYKYHSKDGINKSGPYLMATFRPGHEKDKGYYSDHTYESPRCDGQAQPNKRNTIGRAVNPQEIETDIRLCPDNDIDSGLNTNSG